MSWNHSSWWETDHWWSCPVELCHYHIGSTEVRGNLISVKPWYNIVKLTEEHRFLEFPNRFQNRTRVTVWPVGWKNDTFHTITLSRLDVLCLILHRKTKECSADITVCFSFTRLNNAHGINGAIQRKKKTPSLHQPTGFPKVQVQDKWLYWNGCMASISPMESNMWQPSGEGWAECVRRC
jgi:hypothetical protein